MKALDKKNNYIMHSEYNDHFDMLEDAELGRLIRDVNNYVIKGIVPIYSKEERVIQMAFSFMKATIDLETKNYVDKCKKNKANGFKGGRPANRKPNGFEENQKKPNGYFENPIDIEMDIDNSVCNITTREENFQCHLGSDVKNESCFYCMKKNICPNKESADFKLCHPNETFEKWNQDKIDEINKYAEKTNARGHPVDTTLMEYDWLNSKEGKG